MYYAAPLLRRTLTLAPHRNLRSYMHVPSFRAAASHFLLPFPVPVSRSVKIELFLLYRQIWERHRAMRYDSCRQCTKRRITCDKGTPQCAKCIKKGIECSGLGKKYRFVENKTPETIESSSARSCNIGGRRDEEVAFDEVSNTVDHLSLRSTSDNDCVGFITGEGEDIEATVSPQTGTQHSINQTVLHQPGQQIFLGAVAAQTSLYPLRYPIALHQPGQMMLLDHCKLSLFDPSGIMIGVQLLYFED